MTFSSLLLVVTGAALAAAVLLFFFFRGRDVAQRTECARLNAALQAAELAAVRGEAERERLQAELATLAPLRALPEEAAALRARLEAVQAQVQQAAAQRTEAEAERQRLDAALRQRDARLAELDATLSAERAQLVQQRAFVEQQMKAMQLTFEQQAARILDEKTQKFSEQNKAGLDTLLSPLREQLKDFREKVETTYSNEARERFALKQQIESLEALNRRISDDAANLTKALKGDKKLQGNWGEVILARVLEESGLREGHEYETQFSVTDDEGQRRLPDVVVHLPENRDIVIDAKVSLNDYERYCAEEDTAERERLLRLHTAAVRNHIKALSEKRYEDLPGIRTLDFVFLFMPVEAAFMLAVEHDPALFREAFEKKIIIVSPTTLLATLRTVESIWRYERQNRNAEKIAKEAGLLHDKFAVLLAHLDDLGRALERSQDSFHKTMNSLTGRGGLVGKVDSLRALGAKAKKALPTEKFDIDAAEAELADDALPAPVAGIDSGTEETDA